MNNNLIIVTVIAILIFILFNTKSSFYNIPEELRAENDLYYRPHTFTNQVIPATINNDTLTKSDLKDTFDILVKSIYTNGPPSGANTSLDQNKYDLLFKDIIVNSVKRNTNKYPNPNNYKMNLNLNINKIYKAELIEVYVPAATDSTVNVNVTGNRFYFTYTAGALTTTGYAFILAGTYLNPASVAIELTRNMNLVLTAAGFTLSNTVGVSIIYNQNLNRYIIQDNNYTATETLIVYPTNGFVITPDITVQDSIAESLMLNYEGPSIFSPYLSGPRIISSQLTGLYVDTATNYGTYTDLIGVPINVPTNTEQMLSNSILSGVVLTTDQLYLSLGKLNGDTCNIVAEQDPTVSLGNVPSIFCQVPNNNIASSAAVRTLLNQPNIYSSIQFYNPLLNKLNSIDIQWYTDTGELANILDHTFTLRVYYFQKRISVTDFSYEIP